MHAVVLHAFGPAENLTYETVPDPEPGPGEVRIAVKAAGAHFIETVMRSGVHSETAPPPPELPSVFGGEVSGIVDAVGPGGDASWIGRSVVTAYGRPGGYAELTVAAESALYPVPEGLDHAAAVTMVMTGATTIGLLDQARLTPDDVVLVNSAAGGVGRLVVQFAHRLGATVIGAAGGPAKVAAVAGLGADIAVDYNGPGWEKTILEQLGGRRVSVVLDGVSGDKGRAAFDTLAAGGRYVTIGSSSQQPFEPDAELLAARGVTAVNALLELISHWEWGPDHQRRALAAGAEGRFIPAVQAFPLSQAAAAHAAMERRETTGKVILVP